MLKKYTTSEYLKLYTGLPENVTTLFWDDDISKRIIKIESLFDLKEEQVELLTEITAQVFLGILPPVKLEKAIVDGLGLDETTGKKVTDEFFRTLVFPIKPVLKELYEDDDFRRSEEETPEQKEKREKTGGVGDAYREPIE